MILLLEANLERCVTFFFPPSIDPSIEIRFNVWVHKFPMTVRDAKALSACVDKSHGARKDGHEVLTSNLHNM